MWHTASPLDYRDVGRHSTGNLFAQTLRIGMYSRSMIYLLNEEFLRYQKAFPFHRRGIRELRVLFVMLECINQSIICGLKDNY